ncbi:MAG: T9SS type A sorting domain-containing protein, partial [Candidatus Kapabacteria bacterium]|nr:T9SS type A sorting domain-containing protein [Candidatus Kapabacteria bacterium]
YIQGNSKSKAKILLTTNSGHSWSIEKEDSLARYEHLPKQEIPQQFTIRSTFGGAVEYTNDSGAKWEYLSLPQDSLSLNLVTPYGRNLFYCSGVRNFRTSLYRFDINNIANTEVEVSTDKSQERVWIHEVCPNPFKNIVNAKIGRSDATALNDIIVGIYNIFGELICDLSQEYRSQAINEFNEVEITWTSTGFAQGVYLLRISTHSNSHTVKIAKFY